MTDWYLSPIFDSYAAVIAIGAALAALTAIGFAFRRLSIKQTAALVALRLLAIALLVLVLLQPTLLVTEHKKQTATLVVLVDTSRSMLVPDGRDGRTRWQELRRVLDGAWSDFGELATDLEVKFYGFDAAARELEHEGERWKLPDTPAGDESAIGSVLDDVLRRESRKRLIGVLLLSDGNQQSPRQTLPPQDPARRMADLGYPLYTIAFGGDAGAGQSRDVAIKSLVAGPTVYVKNPLNILAEIQIDGFANDEIPLELSWGQPGNMQVVARRTVKASARSSRVPFEISHTPDAPGEYKLTLRAVPRPGELVTTNNQWSTFITVLQGGLKVLYVEGANRPESVFLRRSVQASEDISVDFLQINQNSKPVRDAWPLDVGERFVPQKYDVYIFGDIDAAAFANKGGGATPAEAYPALEQLRGTIENRAGFMMLGGTHGFGAGRYHQTPLADALPIAMSRLDGQNFDEPLREDLHWPPGPLKMRPTSPRGMLHPVMRLGAGAENAAAWATLPPLDGANRIQPKDVKPRAEILAESAAGDGQAKPLLLAWTYGNGRVLAFAGDSTWRWHLQGKANLHRQFWRQAILWLAQKEDEGNSVWIRLETRRVGLGKPLRFTTGARQGDGSVLAGATFTATLQSPAGTQSPVQTIRQDESATGTITATDASGDYQLVVEATKDGAPVGRATARFYVEAQDLELDNATADPTLLDSLAKITEPFGGQAIYPEALADLLAKLKEAPKSLDVEIHSRWTLAGQTQDGAIILAIFVALLGTEWFLRKRWRLV
ncbi:MAG: hypothetical protein DCC68_23145 [Planctomycetota bacterium]|nr:MAG: hypothetical protein DCC68_23145 [Planctomycetota bacterium]